MTKRIHGRLHTSALIIGLSITSVGAIISWRAGEVRASGQSRSVERDTLENRFAIQSLKEALEALRNDSRSRKSDTDKTQELQEAVIVKLADKVAKLEQEEASMAGGLKVLAWLISACGGLQLFQIFNLHKSKGS